MKILLRTILLLAVAGIIVLVWQARKVLPMAVGYAAKTVCSEYFVAGRPDLNHIWSDVLQINPLFRYTGYELDPENQRVESTAAFGLIRVNAVYRPGLGCTIAAGVDPEELGPLPANDSLIRSQAHLLPGPDAPNTEIETALDRAFSEPGPETHSQTRAIVILHQGRVVAERYAPSFGPQTGLIGWSMTKSIINTLVGMLVSDGALSLDMPAPVPEWQSDEDPRREITLDHLLRMSSGLGFTEVYEPGSDATNMLFTVPAAASYAIASPLAQTPGSHWSYSSGTSNILARIVRDTVGGTEEAVAGFIHSRLTGPLGLSSMVLEHDASGTPVGSSFSYATARDWARLGQFWLQDGVWEGQRLLPEGWIEYSTTPAPATSGGQYGAQFWLNRGSDSEAPAFPDLPKTMFFAHGFNQQIVAIFPEQDVVIARLGFTTDDSWDSNKFMAEVLAALR